MSLDTILIIIFDPDPAGSVSALGLPAARKILMMDPARRRDE
jgi:hypothetical protein